jgi:hypothetical protein
VRAVLLLTFSFGCTTTDTLRPVAWLKIENKSNSTPTLTFPAGPGGIMGLGSFVKAWSYLYLRVASEWKKLPIEPRAKLYVFNGGRSVLVADGDKNVLYTEGAAEGTRLPDELLGIRAGDDRIIFAYCGRQVDFEQCHRVQAEELDAGGKPVASYSVEVAPEDWWHIDGMTAEGLLVHAGAKACREGSPCRNVRCQVAEASPSGLKILARAESCTSDWFPENLAAHRATPVAEWISPGR